MLSNVFLKTLRDQRWPTFWFGLALVAIGLYTIMFYPLIAEATGLLEFIENLPEELTAMFGGALDYSTAEGFLSGELFSFTGPLVVIAYAVFRGATVVAGEEEARTLDQLLANPVPRWRILIEKGAAIIIGIVGPRSRVLVCPGRWSKDRRRKSELLFTRLRSGWSQPARHGLRDVCAHDFRRCRQTQHGRWSRWGNYPRDVLAKRLSVPGRRSKTRQIRVVFLLLRSK